MHSVRLFNFSETKSVIITPKNMELNTKDHVFSPDCFFLVFVGNSTKYQDAFKIFICVVNSVLVLPTILLNRLVIITIWKTPSLRSVPANILLLCLACADFLNGLISQPLTVIYQVGELT